MSDETKAYQATPNATLEQQIMDSRIPKSEREHWAKREIERLRAGQFRWIAVDEGKQPGDTEWILVRSKGGDVHIIRSDHVFRAVYTHWAPMPSPPERTQEEKDKKMFYDWYNNAVGNGAIQAFHAGLKAARGEK